MRWVISATAFCVPLLLIVGIGSCFVEVAPGSGGGRPSLDARGMDELRRLIQSDEQLLDHYACKPGVESTSSIPHLSLDLFDRRGIDSNGHAWYRLAQSPPGTRCGLLRRTAGDGVKIGEIDGRPAAVIMPLGGHWSYWQTDSPSPNPSQPLPKPQAQNISPAKSP
jgi:hypothetical protein